MVELWHTLDSNKCVRRTRNYMEKYTHTLSKRGAARRGAAWSGVSLVCLRRSYLLRSRRARCRIDAACQ